LSLFCANGFHDAEVFTDVPFEGAPGRRHALLKRLPANADLRGARQAT
jgi:hypothetical protein